MRLLPADRWELFQEFVCGRALIEVFEKGGNGVSHATEAPCSTKVSEASVDGGAKCISSVYR